MADRLAVRLRQDAPIPLEVAFECGPGEVLAVFGPSGSGKSTVLRAVAGLSRPAHAEVRCGARVWTDSARGVFEPPHRRPVGFVFQDYALFPHLTARGNVSLALQHLPYAERASRAEALLELVHLPGFGERSPAALSGGERQRVALARALARDPAVLLLDEPFSAVDRAVRRRLQDEVDALRRALGVPLVLVTHDFDDVVRLATHVLLLERGRAIASGPIAEVMRRPDLTWLHEAVGLGAVFDARAARADASGLVALDFGGGVLLVAEAVPLGTTVRVRVAARDVILATRPPQGMSLHNVLAGTVSAVEAAPDRRHVVVQVAVGAVHLLAEVTRDAVTRLDVAVGRPIHALVKSAAVDVRVPLVSPSHD